MSYPCRMTDPFLPIYDFEALENEPEYTPPPPPKSFYEFLRDSRCTDIFGRTIHFDSVNYGCIAINAKDFK